MNTAATTTPVPVWFVGAGPGDPELITVKGQRLIAEADLVLYAGSLVPFALLDPALGRSKAGARLIDSSSLNLEETHALICEAARRGEKVVRLHTGDPALYGALCEQAALLEDAGIAYAVVPGVSAAFAAAAAAAVSLTLPETAQCFSITRLAGRTPVPQRQSPAELAAHGGSLAVYLSAPERRTLAAELGKTLPASTPVVAAYRVGWPEQCILRFSLGELGRPPEELPAERAAALRELDKLTRQITFLILPGQETEQNCPSRLYDPNFSHGFRQAGQDKK